MASKKNEKTLKLDVEVDISEAQKKFTEFQHDFKNKISSTIGDMKNRISTSVTNAIETVYKSLPRTEADEATRSLKKLESEYHKVVDKIKKNSYASSRTIQKNFKEEKTSIDGARKSYESLASTINGKLLKSYNELKQKISEVSTARIKDNKIQDNDKNNGIISAIPRKMASFTSYTIASRTITATINAVMSLARANMQLESSFANIQAIVSASDVEMGKLRNTILRVGEASKYSVEEIAKATTMLGQAGLTADEINNVLETTTQLAAGTGSELSNTVDLMTSALAVWGLNSEEASHLSDVMVTGMNRTKATLETFRMAVQYAGATMASLNVSFDEFASVAAAASNAGLRASVVGTGLRAMTSELISPTKKMVAGLAQLGLSTEDVNIESQGLVNVLYKLKNAGLTAANAYDLFGKRASQFVLAAQGQLAVVDELRVAFNESGATLKAYNTQMDTVSAQWTALINTIKEIGYALYDVINGPLTEFLKMLNKVGQGVVWLFSDKEKLKFEELKKQLEDEKVAAKSFYDFVDQLSKRDYGKDTKQAMEDLNDVIDAVNEKFGKSVGYVEKVEDLADAFERVKNEIKQIGEVKVSGLNVSREEYANKLIQTAQSNYFKMGEIGNKYGKDVSEDYKQAIPKYFEELSRNEGNINKIKRDIKQLKDNALRDTLLAALDEAKDIFEKVGGVVKSEYASDQFNDAIKSIDDEVTSTNKLIYGENGYLTNFKNSLVEVQDGVKESVDFSNQSIEEISKTANKIKDEVAMLHSSSVEAVTDRELMLDELEIYDENERNEYIKSLKDAKQKQLDWFKSLLQQMLDVAEKQSNVDENIKNSLKDYIREYTDVTADIVTQHVNWLNSRSGSKKPRISSPSGDPIREQAEKFNQRYLAQESALRNQKYELDKERARREGVKSRFSGLSLDTSLFTSQYSKLSDLEDKRTAKAQLNLLESYKKDYEELYKKVESGQITLKEADHQSADLISKMRDLEIQTSQAKERFVDLDNVSLEEIQSEIDKTTEETKKLEKEAETTWGQIKGGFQKAVKDMADTYSFASIGKTIAEDLGNGIADALNSIVDGSKSAKDAFSDMARSILQDISKMLIRMAVMKAMFAAFGPSGAQVYDSPIGPMMPAANGGFIPKIRAAAGSMVRGGVQGKDSVPALLMPGEYVLKKSAVDALGTNFLNDLNNNAAQTLTNTAANMVQNPYQEESKSEPAVVNVWVVSKEEEAKMGPNDVIATISKDIMVGGQTRRLIQQVVAGRK